MGEVKLIVSAEIPEEIPELLSAGADEAVLAVQGLSFTAVHAWPYEDISGEKVSLLINKLFFPAELDALTGFFACAAVKQSPAVYFADPAVIAYAEKAGLKEKLIYHPMTLVTSAPEAAWWAARGIKSTVISPLLSIDEMTGILKQVPQAEAVIHGRQLLSVSRRPLLSAYTEEDMRDRAGLYLQEEKREGKMPVYECEEGTMIFSDQILASFLYLKRLRDAGGERFLIEGAPSSLSERCAAVSAYRKILNGEDPDKIAEQFYGIYGKENYGEEYYEEKTIL